MIDVAEVAYISDYTLEIVFDNGEKGRVDFKDYANKGGVFSRLSDPKYFKQAYVNKDVGTICWPDGLDIAPETLYELATGKNPRSVGMLS